MASPAELSMYFKPHSYSMLLKSFGVQTDQTYKLEEFLSRLEEERLKIDAFKRELPLCMQLLTNAVEHSRMQLHAFRSNQGERPVLEEFIPIKHSNSQERTEMASNISDKVNWMTSAQLWGQASEETKPQSAITIPKEADIGFSISPKLTLDNKHRNGGAFSPFSRERNSSQVLRVLPELSLASSEKEIEEKKCEKTENFGVVVDQGKVAAVSSEAKTNTTTTTSQTHRKTRRCWSPDLHRRFVNALQTLGGSQVATPKHIRELMKVHGLTNDEVKSHLKKYRLHTRRLSPSLQTGAPTPQLVVLGGIWVPPEYATAAAAGTSALYALHPPPPLYCAATPVPQQFYTAAPSQSALAPPPHHHALHHHLHLYKTAPHPESSPESDGGNRSESIEDGKSESSSWKDESGENKGKIKGLAALREEGEESTGSEITLKF
ncbi:myb family transcription factor EFM-like [Gastrolobium bilobum]|uniref:myb family transcription factor EFM-like n=1 Tax=Gastrolobium bilobum TaxID=150636 RepID=UPI002AB18D9D|nr:myb family transcription factor EFM-like [Gastrolobium bilobum]